MQEREVEREREKESAIERKSHNWKIGNQETERLKYQKSTKHTSHFQLTVWGFLLITVRHNSIFEANKKHTKKNARKRIILM